MKRAALTVVIAAAALGACAEQPTASARPAAPGAPGRTLISDTPLQVSVSGPTKMYEEGVATYSASVSGGSGSYWYQWISEVCFESGFCYEPNVFAQGSGVSSAQLPIPSDFYRVRVSVQVHEDQTVHRSGIGYRSVLGPAALSQSGPSGTWGCRKPGWYPHKDWTWNGTTWDPGKPYARDCFGARVYDPAAQ
jgi:hypothetical protein